MFAAMLTSHINEQMQMLTKIQRSERLTAKVFSGVSLMTVTAISVGRLLAWPATQAVTLRRVSKVSRSFWFLWAALSLMDSIRTEKKFHSGFKRCTSKCNNLLNNMGLLLHKDLSEPLQSSSSHTR